MRQQFFGKHFSRDQFVGNLFSGDYSSGDLIGSGFFIRGLFFQGMLFLRTLFFLYPTIRTRISDSVETRNVSSHLVWKISCLETSNKSSSIKHLKQKTNVALVFSLCHSRTLARARCPTWNAITELFFFFFFFNNIEILKIFPSFFCNILCYVMVWAVMDIKYSEYFCNIVEIFFAT